MAGGIHLVGLQTNRQLDRKTLRLCVGQFASRLQVRRAEVELFPFDLRIITVMRLVGQLAAVILFGMIGCAQTTTGRTRQTAFVTLGDIDQWIDIRGDDRANPVLLATVSGRSTQGSEGVFESEWGIAGPDFFSASSARRSVDPMPSQIRVDLHTASHLFQPVAKGVLRCCITLWSFS